MTIDVTELNVLAILAGGILYMVFGALYYSPVLFGNTWVKSNQLSDTHMKNGMIYAGAALVAFISSFLVAVIVQATGADDLASGLVVGLIIGLLVALAYWKNTLFGMTNKKVFAIAVGDHLISFLLLSVLHALW
jgi:hypothetical protein